MSRLGNIFSRVAAGAVSFACAGYLVQAILVEHGGTQQSQSDWRLARERSIVVSSSRYDDALPPSERDGRPNIDYRSTGSVESLREIEAEKPKDRPEPTVLSLIRENADLQPGVSYGTNRVSVTVKKGDTLFGIALRHGLKVKQLARLNGLSEPYIIKVGQTLYVAR